MFFQRSHSFSMRAVLLAGIDLLAVWLSFYAAFVIRFGQELGIQKFAGDDQLMVVLLSGIVFVTVFYICGLYEVRVIAQRGSMMLTAAVASVLSVIVIILLFFGKYDLLLGRGILFLAFLIALGASVAVRSIYRAGVGRGFFLSPTLLVGDPDDVLVVSRLIANSDESLFKVFGAVVLDEVPGERFIEELPILGGYESLNDFVKAYSIENIIVATSLGREYELLRQLRPLRYTGVQLLDYVSLYEHLDASIPIDHIDDEWLMHAAMNSARIHIRKLKRIVDVFLAVVGLVISAPIMLLTMLIVKLDSRGPVFFAQERVGLNGALYTLYKVRSMKVDAEEESGAVWAGEGDSRVTRSGRWLRLFRIDEIPQLWNVLKGEMSLVGPRPERPEFVDQLSEEIPFYRERLVVLPGITGWAQVMYPYAASVHASRRKLQYDLYYIKFSSLVLDGAILLRTFKTILLGLRHSDAMEAASEEPPSEVKVIPIDRGRGEKSA